MSTVADAIAHGRRGIAELEPGITRQLLASYEDVWRHVDRTIRQYEAQIQAAVDAGIEPRPSWLRQQVWYRQVQASIDDQFIRFNADAARIIGLGQSETLGISGESTAIFRHAVGIDTSFAGRVNVNAFERWVTALQPGTPIRGVIEKYGPRAQEAITRHLTNGIGSGQGVNTIVRNISREVGDRALEPRLMTLVQNETMRAFRGSSADSYDAMPDGVITGYQWACTKSVRTCIACLAKDGSITKAYPTQQHVKCRCIGIPVVSEALIPPGTPRETGADWFARQDEATQRRILPTNGHFEAYQQGTSLSDMTGIHRNKTWGSSVYVKPLKAMDVPSAPVAPPTPRDLYNDLDLRDKLLDEAEGMENGFYERVDAGDTFEGDEDDVYQQWLYYKSADYREINAELRNWEYSWDPYGENARDRAFGDYTLDLDAKVYRGVSSRQGGASDTLFATSQPGDVLTDKGYTSVSIDYDKAASFAEAPGGGKNSYLFEIDAPPGVHYAPIDFPGSPREGELVLPPGSSMLVRSIDADEYGRVVFRATPLPPGETAAGWDVTSPNLLDDVSEAWNRWEPRPWES